MKKILVLLSFVFLLTACTKDELKTSYLQQFVTEDTTILCCFYCSEDKEITKERVLQQLDIEMDFLEKEYEIIEPQKPEPNQVYEVISKDESKDHFKVYYINNTGIITAKRAFINNAIAVANQIELETGEEIYAPIKWGTYIVRYDIGQKNIQETDTEYIKKAEEYIQSIFPYLDFNNYTLKVSEGDAGQIIFNYYTKKALEKNQIYDFSWISPLNDTHIDIIISNRDLLDTFIYNK